LNICSVRRSVVAIVAATASIITPTFLGAGVASASTRTARPAPSAPVPTVTGPVTGPGTPNLVLAAYPFSKVGYAESEFFFSGTASAYTSSAPLSTDGKWSVQPSGSAAYTSRMVVVRPTNPAKFSGTVVVEWLNVTAGFDSAVEWIYGHDEMLRSGDIYVGVSAQAAGVNYIKNAEPARYSTLVHPGDSFSYDIFSQAGMAVRDKASMLFSGMAPKVVLATGQSQSSARLSTYLDSVAPLTHVYDGYIVHSRFGAGAPLSQTPQAAITPPVGQQIRNDLTVPVMVFETETEILPMVGINGTTTQGYATARQPDTQLFRDWEVAGATHIDGYNTSGLTLNDDGNWASDLQLFAMLSSPVTAITPNSGLPINLSCGGYGFNAGEEHYVYNAALHDMTLWVRSGVAPPKMSRLAINTSSNPPTYRLDGNGNVVGGVRTPAVDVPLASLSGLSPSGAPSFCTTFGQTHPFTSTQVASLYPTQADFVSKWKAAVQKDMAAGGLLPADASRLDVVAG